MKMSLRTRKLGSNSVCSVKMSWRPSAVFAGQVPHVGTVLTLECVIALICAWEEVSHGQQSIVKLPLAFQRPGFPYKTEWVDLNACHYDFIHLWQMNVLRLLQRCLSHLIPCTYIEPL